MVQVGDAATIKEKEVKTKYPIEEGLIAGTTSQTGRITNLVPEQSLILKDRRVGL